MKLCLSEQYVKRSLSNTPPHSEGEMNECKMLRLYMKSSSNISLDMSLRI